jgi:hypothetical protein
MNNQLPGCISRRPQWPLIIAAAALVCLSTGSTAQSQRRNNSRTGNAGLSRITLPTGTVIPLRLDGSLSSRNNEQGDKFSATIKSGQDDASIPTGTRVEGVVREAQASGNGKPGVLDVDFRRMVFPNGGSQSIAASLTSLNGKDVTRQDGRLVATGDRGKDRLKWVGIGAGAGVLVSVLTKGNTLLDGVLGAGAGYLFNEVGNKPKAGDIELKQGAEFGIRLDRELAFTGEGRQFYRSDGSSGNYGRSGSAGSQDGDRVNRDDRSSDRSSSGTEGAVRNQDRRFNSDSDRNNSQDNSESYSRPLGVRMLINDRPVRFNRESQPFVQNGVLFVPLAAVGRAAEFDYRYDSANKVIYARNDSVKLPLNSRMVTVDGDRHGLPARGMMRNGTTYVPLQFIGWAADGDVSWNAGSRTATLRTRNN